jgi:polyisoprenoid-binding protein YceI
MRFARACAALLLLAGLADASAPAPAQDAKLTIDGKRSSARFIVRLIWGMRTEGTIARVTGELRGDAASGWVVRVDADGHALKVSGPRWMERSTRSEQFLDVDRHPEIRFQSQRFNDQLLHTGGPVSGELTLRGLTRPVSFVLLPSACAQPGRDCDLQVNGTISRNEFGMTAHRSTVKDNVELHMRVRFRPVGSSG